MYQQQLWIFDESKFNPTLIEALSEGKAKFVDGVAYWIQGSERVGIIQHLPLKEVSISNIEEAVKIAESATAVAASVSTGLILAAIAVQTKFLADKLNTLQSTVDEIAKDVHSQHILFYMDKITEYVGHVEAAKCLLKDRSIADEIVDIASPMLGNLASKRNQVLSFIDNILNLVNSKAEITPKHFELIISFVHMIMELIPFGIYVEHLLCARIGKIRLSEQILIDGAERFNAVFDNFRSFMNQLHRDVVRGQLGEREKIFFSVEEKIVKLFKSGQHKYLLSPQEERVAVLLK